MLAVRLAVPSDIPVLVELMREFYGESGFPLETDWAARAFRELMAEPARGAIWLIDDDGAAVGHTVLSVRFTMEFGGLSGYVDDLFVRPAHRRKGVASAGLDALVAECHRRSCRSIHVEVGPDNAAGLALYRRYGFLPQVDRREHLRVVL